MSLNKIAYPLDSSLHRGRLVPVVFTWNGATVTASTVKGASRYVQSVVFSATGRATITFRENMGLLLHANPAAMTADGVSPSAVMSVGAYVQANAAGKSTLSVQAFSGATLGTATNPTTATITVLCLFTANINDR